MNLTIAVRKVSAETRVLTVQGEIDVYTSAYLKEHVATAIAEGAKHVAMNLSGVEYLDSTGLGVLIGALKNLKERNGSLILIGPSRRISRIFEITGLHKIFTVYQTEAEAASKEGIGL